MDCESATDNTPICIIKRAEIRPNREESRFLETKRIPKSNKRRSVAMLAVLGVIANQCPSKMPKMRPRESCTDINRRIGTLKNAFGFYESIIPKPFFNRRNNDTPRACGMNKFNDALISTYHQSHMIDTFSFSIGIKK